MSRTGIVLADCTIVSEGSPTVVRVDLGLHRHRFLRDHLVDSRPLLSTVMGMETMACAVATVHPHVDVTALADVQVGSPFFLPPSGDGHVEVVVSPGPPVRCEVRSPAGDAGGSVLHFSGAVPTPATVPGAAFDAVDPTGPTADHAAIYALFFHGESFRVVSSAHLVGDTMRGRLAPQLPPITTVPTTSIMAPLLIELCLQTAGLWELAVCGRMAIPSSIERVTRFTDVDSPSPAPLTAIVTPRADGLDRFVFDATVIDEQATPHLTVAGYRTTAFRHPYDSVAAARLRAALGN